MSDAVTTIDRAEIERQVKRAVQGDQLADVTARFRTLGGRVINQQGADKFVFDVVPLKDANDANSTDDRFELSLWVDAPYSLTGNSVSTEDQVKAARTLHALYPERIPFISKKREDGSWKKEVEYERELEPYLVEVSIFALELKANPTMLADRYFYSKTKGKTTGKGVYFNSVAPELLPSMTLTDPSQFLKT